MRSGDIPAAMDAFNRVLSIDEHNERVLNLVQRLGRRQRIRRAVMWAAAGIAVVCLGGFFTHAMTLRAAKSAEAARREQARVNHPPPSAATDPASAPKAAADPAPHPGRAKASPPLSAAAAPRKASPRPAPPVKTEPPPQPIDPTAPRRVVLRPEPANMSIGVDGAEPREFGPSFHEVTLTPGSHVFEFRGAHDCCVDEKVTREIPAGVGTIVLAHRLRFRPAGLYVKSNTPADVFVDNVLRGRTWSVIQVPQPDDMIAPHVIRVSAEGHREQVREVRLRAGQLESVEITLESNAGASPPG
jgi:hypothetical protein